MDYVIKRDRGVWILELIEGRYVGTKYRFETKTALTAGITKIAQHLVALEGSK